MTIKPSEAFKYYTSIIYWNDFPEVRAYLNKLATGDPSEDWKKLLRPYPSAKRLLSLNCGNGWVEREFCELGLADSIIGIDISAQLLEEGQRLANQAGLIADYRVMDANTAHLDGLAFDHVLNHAALHHVAYLDRIVREVCRHMPADGLFINYDYVGPHRNQYPWEAWSRMVELWDELPAALRTDLRYPYVPTMLATDPTEAIHSDLILGTLQRYFHFIEARPLGGAIAYQLLWDNKGLHQASKSMEGRFWLNKIIEEDEHYTDGRLDRSLFAFLLCRPKKDALNDERQLDVWAREEVEREFRAQANGGRYQPKSALEIIYQTGVSLLGAEGKPLVQRRANSDQTGERRYLQLKAKHETAVRRLAKARKKEKRRYEQLKAVYASFLWRITRPLRAINRTFLRWLRQGPFRGHQPRQ